MQGKQHVDYCFVSNRLLDHVICRGFEAFHALIGSDHRGYFIDISMQGLFDRRLPPIINPIERCIRSSHPCLVRNYTERLSDYFEDHSIIEKMKKAQHYYKLEKVEKLDK